MLFMGTGCLLGFSRVIPWWVRAKVCHKDQRSCHETDLAMKRLKQGGSMKGHLRAGTRETDRQTDRHRESKRAVCAGRDSSEGTHIAFGTGGW